MATFSHTLSALLSSLEKRSREDGSLYWAFSNDAPDWAQSIVREAHCGELPNDSRYELIRDCLVAISDEAVSSEEEARNAIPDLSLGLLPGNTGDLLQWFSEGLSRLSDCDRAAEDGRLSEPGIYEILTEGFRIAAEETLYCLVSGIEEAKDKCFNPDTDCKLVLSGRYGQYIPQFYCSDIEQADCSLLSVCWDDVLDCQAGPEGERYWEAWDNIVNNLTLKADGDWRLFQDSDLWMIRDGVELPDEWS